MTLIDSAGQQYRTSITDTGAGQGFGGSVTMPPGDTRVGFVTFEIPDSAQPFKMQMALDSGFADQAAEFALA
jgi:hypothetical protein